MPREIKPTASWLHGKHARCLLGGWPPPLLLRCRPPFLSRKPATVRAAGGFSRPAARHFRSKAPCHKVGEFGQGDLAIAQLGAVLRRRNSKRSGDETRSEPPDQNRPLAARKYSGVPDVPGELHAAVRGVDVLTARPGRTRKPPLEFSRGNRELGRHLQIHATSVA